MKGTKLMDSCQMILQVVGRTGVLGAIVMAGMLPANAIERPDLERALRDTQRFFEQQVSAPEASWLGILGYLHRRFGLEVLLASGALAHEIRELGPGQGSAVFRRTYDPAARTPAEAIAALEDPVGRTLAQALHCDRVSLPDDWANILEKTSREGEYALTHAVVATRWSVEKDCWPAADLERLRHEQIQLLLRTIKRHDRDSIAHRAPLDLWVEALAVLAYAGAADQVVADWLDELMEHQRPDGGWPTGPRSHRSSPHTTALALWVLLEQLRPEAPAVSWLPADP